MLGVVYNAFFRYGMLFFIVHGSQDRTFKKNGVIVPMWGCEVAYNKTEVHIANTTGEVMWSCNVTTIEHEVKKCKNSDICSLTWPRVSRCAIFLGVVAATTGRLFVALQNGMALVRGTEVAWLE